MLNLKEKSLTVIDEFDEFALDHPQKNFNFSGNGYLLGLTATAFNASTNLELRQLSKDFDIHILVGEWGKLVASNMHIEIVESFDDFFAVCKSNPLLIYLDDEDLEVVQASLEQNNYKVKKNCEKLHQLRHIKDN